MYIFVYNSYLIGLFTQKSNKVLPSVVDNLHGEWHDYPQFTNWEEIRELRRTSFLLSDLSQKLQLPHQVSVEFPELSRVSWVWCCRLR